MLINLKFFFYFLLLLVPQVTVAELPAEEVKLWVRSGMYDKSELMEMFLEEIYSPGELNRAELEKLVDNEIKDLKTQQKSWPKETDNDKLDRVFKALNAAGIVSLQNAGMTLSDGLEDVSEIYSDAKDKSKIKGYCFYHSQDTERAVNGEGLNLAFGPMDTSKEKELGPVIGKQIVTSLEQVGFKIEWDGTFDKRIRIKNFDWKKRLR